MASFSFRRLYGFALLSLLLWIIAPTESYYVPGVNPRDFEKGDQVHLMVNKMTSSKTLLPVEYYRLPFCTPEWGAQKKQENLGMFLAGDRIASSPYQIHMLEDVYCKHLCVSHLGKSEGVGAKPNSMIRAIRAEYHHNWILDNLSAGSKFSDREFYGPGFPIGFVSYEDSSGAFIHNHVNINITYHKLPGTKGADNDKYRVVRFLVEPLSIRHTFETSDDGDVIIKGNPVATCLDGYGGEKHTNLAMIEGNYQPASGQVLFTYDVIWVEDPTLRWASRWDICLSMDDPIPDRVHWLSIINGLVVAFVLTAAIAVILIRHHRRVYAKFDRLSSNDEENEGENSGTQTPDVWLLVNGDVFRPPRFSPMLLAACCGTGAQLLCTSVLTILLALMGFLSPAMRGALLMALLLLYALTGGVGGYVTARLYKAFDGKSWRLATCVTAFGFPGFAFTHFLLQVVAAAIEGSTLAVPFSSVVVLLLLWLVILAPLVFCGAHIGFKREVMKFPGEISGEGSQPSLQDRSGRPDIWCGLGLGGILPFYASFLEFYFIMPSIWMNQYYYVFGFLLLAVIIVALMSAETSILVCFFYLRREHYRWWWRSFCTSGSTALWAFLYSCMYFRQLEENYWPSLGTYFIYYGYMTLICIALFLMTGCIGVYSCLWFNKTLFAGNKVG